ncbi:MAG: DUF3619 family protein [Xanthomonadaceae bacterium]|nr:DUF3619 family protein [Xanthomonadaceae bacterium]MDE2280284.1 DUF3619 family protein [Xanthomonadaceae bacterium]
MNTPESTPDMPLEQRARGLYHEAARNLDPATAGRLRAARREALAGTRHRTAHHVARWLVPSGACAVIALAALLAWPSAPRPGGTSPTAAVATGEADSVLPPDPEQADPTLYQNLDFYGWLAANGATPPAH